MFFNKIWYTIVIEKTFDTIVRAKQMDWSVIDLLK